MTLEPSLDRYADACRGNAAAVRGDVNQRVVNSHDVADANGVRTADVILKPLFRGQLALGIHPLGGGDVCDHERAGACEHGYKESSSHLGLTRQVWLATLEAPARWGPSA